MAFEKGDVFGSVQVDLSGKKLVLVYPEVQVSTPEAYSRIEPQRPEQSVKEIIENHPVEQWKELLVNDFEKSVFELYPQVKELKEAFYQAGALYASMSGSGSSVFGIFEPDIDTSSVAKNYAQRWEMNL